MGTGGSPLAAIGSVPILFAGIGRVYRGRGRRRGSGRRLRHRRFEVFFRAGAMPKINVAAVHNLDVSAALAAQRTQQKALGSGAMPNLRLILLDQKNDRPQTPSAARRPPARKKKSAARPPPVFFGRGRGRLGALHSTLRRVRRMPSTCWSLTAKTCDGNRSRHEKRRSPACCAVAEPACA